MRAPTAPAPTIRCFRERKELDTAGVARVLLRGSSPGERTVFLSELESRALMRLETQVLVESSSLYIFLPRSDFRPLSRHTYSTSSTETRRPPRGEGSESTDKGK